MDVHVGIVIVKKNIVIVIAMESGVHGCVNAKNVKIKKYKKLL